MRAAPLLVIVLLVFSAAVYGKKNAVATQAHSWHKYNLANGKVQIDIPTTLYVDSEYYHYWDACPLGGYSISFEGNNSSKGGMSLQVYLHDKAEGGEWIHEDFEPHTHALENAELLKDTTYIIGNKRYTVLAKLSCPATNKSRRKSFRSYNYHLSYYIVSGSRMLELHYNYWDKDGTKLNHWQETAYTVANSIQWYSTDGATAKK